MNYRIVQTDGNGRDEQFVGPDLCDRFAARECANMFNTYQSFELARSRRYYKIVEDGYVLKNGGKDQCDNS